MITKLLILYAFGSMVFAPLLIIAIRTGELRWTRR